MDHHCIWINNCVGQNNHKYFILFTFWFGVASIPIPILMIEAIYWDNHEWFGLLTRASEMRSVGIVFGVFVAVTAWFWAY